VAAVFQSARATDGRPISDVHVPTYMRHGAKQYRKFNSRARTVLHEPSIGKQAKLRNKRRTESSVVATKRAKDLRCGYRRCCGVSWAHSTEETKLPRTGGCAYVLNPLLSMSRKRERHATRQHRDIMMVVVWVLWRTPNTDAAQRTNKNRRGHKRKRPETD
jgi:hypothetical protein